jgi:glucose repression mediator protein
MAEVQSHFAALDQIVKRASEEIESAYACLIRASDLVHCQSDSIRAIRRLTAYNPTNRIISELVPVFLRPLEALSARIKSATAALANCPTDPKSSTVIGHCYLLLGDYSNAYVAYSRLLPASTISDPYFYFGVAIACQRLQGLDQQRQPQFCEDPVAWFQKVLTLDPEFPLSDDVTLRLAIAHRASGNCDEALRLFTALLSAPPPGLNEDDIKFQLAFTCQLAGMRARAQTLYTELSRAHPGCLPLLQQYLWFLVLGSDPTALHLAKSILDALPADVASDSLINFTSARLAMKLQGMTVAYKRYCACIQDWSECPLYWCDLGVLYFQNEQLPDSILAFQRALYVKPEIVEGWLNLGFVFEYQGDLRAALAIYQSGIQSCSSPQVLRDRLALVGTGQRTAAGLVEIDETRCFVQVADKIGMDLASTPPDIPPEQISDDPAMRSIVALKSPFKSIFAV